MTDAKELIFYPDDFINYNTATIEVPYRFIQLSYPYPTCFLIILKYDWKIVYKIEIPSKEI